MKKSNNAPGTFGAPKPLPGQPGYKETESDRLKKEANDMEARLVMLQDKMKTQQLDGSVGGAQAGSGKWKSAGVEKGSIRAYGKEVQEKVKKRLDASGGGDPALRSTKRPPKVLEMDFKSKDVSEWAVPDVSAWLTELQLQQYVSAFAQNAISGSVLVDITSEDLDYMEIKALGHRKIILKCVEDLRTNNFFSAAALSSPQKAPAILRTSSNPNISGAKQSPTNEVSQAKTTHWSNLEPISQNKVSNPRGGGMINPADNEPGGLLDEAAERAAFAEAVAEWRRADEAAIAAGGTKKALVIEREYLTGPAGGAKKKKSTAGTGTGTGTGTTEEEEEVSAGGMGMWKNPFAPPAASAQNAKPGYAMNDDLDEEAERKAFQEAVMEWRRGPSTTTTGPTVAAGTATTSTFTARGPSAQLGAGVGHLDDSFESDHGFSSPMRGGGGAHRGAGMAASPGSLRQGELDEAREHAEFVKAVDSWRGGATAGGAKPASSFTALADKISEELETAKLEISQKLQKQKEEAERRMQEANLELKRLRSAKNVRDDENSRTDQKSSAWESKRGDQGSDFDDQDDDDDDAEVGPAYTYSYSSAPGNHIGQSHRAVSELPISPRVVVVPGSAAPTPRGPREVGENSHASQSVSSVGVALVESVLGGSSSSAKAGDNEQEEEYFVVEVDSDDE